MCSFDLSDIISGIAILISVWSICQAKSQFQSNLREQTRSLNYSLYEKRLELLQRLGKRNLSIEDIKDSVYNLVDKCEEELKILFSQEIVDKYMEVKELDNQKYQILNKIDKLQYEVVKKKGHSCWDQLEEAEKDSDVNFESLSNIICSGFEYNYFDLSREREKANALHEEKLRILLSDMSIEIKNSISESSNKKKKKPLKKCKVSRRNK